jgi:hypothetical protein
LGWSHRRGLRRQQLLPFWTRERARCVRGDRLSSKNRVFEGSVVSGPEPMDGDAQDVLCQDVGRVGTWVEQPLLKRLLQRRQQVRPLVPLTARGPGGRTALVGRTREPVRGPYGAPLQERRPFCTRFCDSGIRPGRSPRGVATQRVELRGIGRRLKFAPTRGTAEPAFWTAPGQGVDAGRRCATGNFVCRSRPPVRTQLPLAPRRGSQW